MRTLACLADWGVRVLTLLQVIVDGAGHIGPGVDELIPSRTRDEITCSGFAKRAKPGVDRVVAIVLLTVFVLLGPLLDCRNRAENRVRVIQVSLARCECGAGLALAFVEGLIVGVVRANACGRLVSSVRSLAHLHFTLLCRMAAPGLFVQFEHRLRCFQRARFLGLPPRSHLLLLLKLLLCVSLRSGLAFGVALLLACLLREICLLTAARRSFGILLSALAEEVIDRRLLGLLASPLRLGFKLPVGLLALPLGARLRFVALCPLVVQLLETLLARLLAELFGPVARLSLVGGALLPFRFAACSLPLALVRAPALLSASPYRPSIVFRICRRAGVRVRPWLCAVRQFVGRHDVWIRIGASLPARIARFRLWLTADRARRCG